MRLETPRLLLRDYEPADLDFFCELQADPEVMRYIGDGTTLSRAQAVERFARWSGPAPAPPGVEHGFFVALAKSDERPVGHVALIVQDVEGQALPEIGWWLARAAWGRGFASEAAAALRDYAFERAGYPGIIHLIKPVNRRSIAVAQRIGSRFERNATFRGQACCIYAQQRPALQPPALGAASKEFGAPPSSI